MITSSAAVEVSPNVRAIFAKQNRSQEKQEQKVKTILDKMRPQEPSQQQMAPEKRG